MEKSEEGSIWIGIWIMAIVVIVINPILIFLLPLLFLIFIYCKITNSEEKVFRKSGYNNIYPDYFPGITKNLDFLIFKFLKDNEIEFEHHFVSNKSFDEIIFVVEKDGKYFFIKSDQGFVGLHFDEFEDFLEDNGEEKVAKADTYPDIPFETMIKLIEEEYPTKSTEMYICLFEEINLSIEYNGYYGELLKQVDELIKQDIRYVTLSELQKILLKIDF